MNLKQGSRVDNATKREVGTFSLSQEAQEFKKDFCPRIMGAEAEFITNNAFLNCILGQVTRCHAKKKRKVTLIAGGPTGYRIDIDTRINQVEELTALSPDKIDQLGTAPASVQVDDEKDWNAKTVTELNLVIGQEVTQEQAQKLASYPVSQKALDTFWEKNKTLADTKDNLWRGDMKSHLWHSNGEDQVRSQVMTGGAEGVYVLMSRKHEFSITVDTNKGEITDCWQKEVRYSKSWRKAQTKVPKDTRLQDIPIGERLPLEVQKVVYRMERAQHFVQRARQRYGIEKSSITTWLMALLPTMYVAEEGMNQARTHTRTLKNQDITIVVDTDSNILLTTWANMYGLEDDEKMFSVAPLSALSERARDLLGKWVATSKEELGRSLMAYMSGKSAELHQQLSTRDVAQLPNTNKMMHDMFDTQKEYEDYMQVFAEFDQLTGEK